MSRTSSAATSRSRATVARARRCRTARRRCRRPPGRRHRVVRHRAGEDDVSMPAAACRTRGSSGPSPMNTAPMSRRPRARSVRDRVDQVDRAVPASGTRRRTPPPSSRGGRANGTGRRRHPGGTARCRRPIRARATRRGGMPRGRMARARRHDEVGAAHSRSRQRRIGSTMQRAIQQRLAAIPDSRSTGAFTSSTATAPTASRRRESPSPPKLWYRSMIDVGPDACARCGARRRSRPAAGAATERRRQRDPAHRRRPRPLAARRHERVTSWPSAASPSATAVTCTDPPIVPGHDLVDGGVEDLHGMPSAPGGIDVRSTSSAKNGPDSIAAEQQQVQLHRRRQRAQRRVGRRARRDRAAFAARSRLRVIACARRRPSASASVASQHAWRARRAIARSAIRIRMFSTKPPTIGV